ncbi:crotonase/enoyl-CoA hydratase family protein [Pacificibacter marinus]|uniref:1,2-epoxyphenylacetyl-CoA isomerase n=1 Tax=Pacificibacter marinus TaxID=658057 RepID=A0A1Y5RY21_9RHOB|nr:crotonase/enoyl-CoA hydratase family protein [Pacificibacter marinus]SEK36601.1 short chain enoyl-CoA hydratase [Pacificibacter marinus]SLN26792.1 1,2-epoxyphenylacetyl-CoA isomerase [Pacificibacter marinus]
MTDKLLITQEDGIATLTLNMPDLRNPITDTDVVEEICAAMDWLNSDQSIRCAILTGAGKAFSSGGNLKHMRDKEGIFNGDAIAVRNSYRAGIQRVAKAVWSVEVPMIAAVNGPAYGAGCDLTLFCDIRIASETAVFAENFVNVGIVSGDGGSWILPRQVGLSRAAEMAFTADPIDAETALAWGLVSQITPPEGLMDAAMNMAKRIARNPPRQLRLTKRLMREGTNSTLDQVLELSAAYQGAAHQTQDHAEAVSALLERREGKFNGT